MSLRSEAPGKATQPRSTPSSAGSSIQESDAREEGDPRGYPKGGFLSWKIGGEPAKPRYEDQSDPGLLFINHTSPANLRSRDRRKLRSHVMQRYVHQRRRKLEKEEAVDENREGVQGRPQLVPKVNEVLGAGRVDPFKSLPVIMSSSMSRLLDHYATILAPLHYPRSSPAGRNPMTTIWTASALTDVALLHSTLCSTSGHLLRNANQPELLSVYLSHKAETIRIVNERMTDISKALTDETLGAIALLVTGQTCHGDYNEMNIHMRGLAKLIGMRGGLETLGMGGLLAGEILWCDNVTAFLSSSKPLLSLPETTNTPFEAFEDPELNLFFTNCQASDNSNSSLLWNPALLQILSDGLIIALRNLYTMTALLDTCLAFSEHDMLVYDRKRASVQHQLADLPIPPLAVESYHITESCRIAAVIYSNLALWGFRPPMNLYGDLARMLQAALQATDRADHWGTWWDILLWTLFIGGYAALKREERMWFSRMIREVLQERGLRHWVAIRNVLERMPICRTLLDPFETLWCEAAAFMPRGEVVKDGDLVLSV